MPRIYRSLTMIVVGVVLCTATGFGRLWRRSSTGQKFTATAFSVKGKTADGSHAHTGTAAADPAVLPLGSRIRIRGAGKYSGLYIVSDTGGKVIGRRVDIYVPSEAEAKRFGKKNVIVDVLQTSDTKN